MSGPPHVFYGDVLEFTVPMFWGFVLFLWLVCWYVANYIPMMMAKTRKLYLLRYSVV